MWIYLGIVNTIALLMMGIDKRRAVRGGRRVPEKRLFLAALIGGAAGILVGMLWFRHKTRHVSFRLGIPLLLMAQVAAVAAVALRFGGGWGSGAR
jgi:uncharacterized membrane protein YsdA (DUF1294 family)